ncbi:MAG: ABC transporter ATP-binding protein/permease [Oscillospiraceae bacterium]|nr:ABC transporter ATP-binding protein/permease [Oscillospiraceae bacterium]
MNKKIRKLISYYKPYKKTFFTDLFCALTHSLISLTIPFIIHYIINNVLTSQKSEAVKIVPFLIGIMAILFIAKYACNYYIVYYGHLMGSKIERDMRKELFSYYQKFSLSFYDDQKIGKLMSRITNDLKNISEFLHHAPEDLTTFTLTLLGIIPFLIFINNKLAFIAIFVITLILAITLCFMPKISKAITKNLENTAEINSQIEETLSGIKVVKSFANEKIEMNKFDKTNEDFVESKRHFYKAISSYFPLIDALTTGLIPIISIIAMFFILNGGMAINDLLTFTLYANIIVGPIFRITSLIEQFQESFAGYERFLEVLKIKPEIVDSENAIELRNIKGNILFENVSFNYNQSKENVFQNLNLKINAGEYIALVGPSGVGKSTFCSLIPRLYELTGGKITIDNIDIRDIKLKNLRENIGFVHQDIYLFSGTIASNIKYGKINATEEEIIKAAKNAYIHDFIMNLPEGYNTEIGQKGTKLSGGQKQRLAIARVFLKNPPILIFDEATSSLDNESEKYVQDSLEKLAKNRTTIVIAHRLSTIRNAGKIIVLKDGKIIESGIHDELIQKNGPYAELYNLL